VGPATKGRASYQVELTVCEECQRGKQGRGEPLAVSADVVEMAQCDGQQLRDAHVGANVSDDVTMPTTRALTHVGQQPNLERVLRSALGQLSAHTFARAS
jgi:hypothetical protein